MTLLLWLAYFVGVAVTAALLERYGDEELLDIAVILAPLWPALFGVCVIAAPWALAYWVGQRLGTRRRGDR